jgi:hypothetical protein
MSLFYFAAFMLECYRIILSSGKFDYSSSIYGQLIDAGIILNLVGNVNSLFSLCLYYYPIFMIINLFSFIVFKFFNLIFGIHHLFPTDIQEIKKKHD